MPTIDELPAAVSVSDTDELVVSQTDIARKATRAQILAGVQQALALPQNSLLGRTSPGVGAPESLTIGANLTVSNSVISAPAAFVISSLSQSGTLQANDLVAVSQGGQNLATPYAAFMGGLGGLSGISGSNLLAAPIGGVGARTLSEILADALSIESFGAVGDGITDDTSAFIAAGQAGRPIRLDAKTYVVNGPLLINNASVWLGIANNSVVRRLLVTGQAPWIEIDGPLFSAVGIIFDANGLAGVDSPVLQVDGTCQQAEVMGCQFTNGRGARTGNGLAIICSNSSVHKIQGCIFEGNDLNGLGISGGGIVQILNCNSINNKGDGISIDAITSCKIVGNTCANNSVGISVGDWQASAPSSNSTDACMIGCNNCSSNSLWGLAISGYAAIVENNAITVASPAGGAGGMVARLGASLCGSNRISGGGAGLDGRTSWGSVFSANSISNAQTGAMLGGCQNLTFTNNFLLMNVWGIDASAIEPGLSLAPTGPLSLCGNWIGFTSAQGGGIFVHDGALGVSILNNDVNGWGSATLSQALWLHTDQALLKQNRWNNQPQFSVNGNLIDGVSTLVVPDIADTSLILSVNNPVLSLLTTHQLDTLGQITFIRVTSGGSGYTTAQVAISGSGRGAEASAIVSGGSVLWVVITNPGSGYGPIGMSATATISGDGEGAAATAYVGLPVLTGRALRLTCNTATQFAITGTSPPQQNWTNFQFTVPALGAVELEGTFGSWRAVSFPATDYLAPTGSGGAIIQSAAGGDVTLRPGPGGELYIASAVEQTGCTSNVGRGSPIGSISAPPGSDFRNLDGGAGNTFWIKQNGSDTSGWIAVA